MTAVRPGWASSSVLLGALALGQRLEARTLTFDERVEAQLRIERVYDAHRTWPGDNPGARPSFETRADRSAVARKVESYLRKTAVLSSRWGVRVSGRQLQAEVERMARSTQDPATLRELFRVLGDDPYVIAECLGRQAFATRQYADRAPRATDEDLDAIALPPGWREPAIDEAAPFHSVRVNGNRRGTGMGGAAPDPRAYHTAVWTGSEMIVCGGTGGAAFATGGRYDPATDTWTATSALGAPGPRARHTAIWTGSEMIVWGGDPTDYGGGLNDGGRYDPAIDAWRPLSTWGAPPPRRGQSVVWTGSTMIVWGGTSTTGDLDTGGTYDPASDSWTPTSLLSAPSPRSGHTAVWTGSLMIVWGGSTTNSGGIYDPIADAWRPTSLAGPVPSPRSDHTAAWTGTEMIAYGGVDANGATATGGRYDPIVDRWQGMAVSPSVYVGYAVWSGSEVLIPGGRYDPVSDSWRPMSSLDMPVVGRTSTSVWTGDELVTWGGVVGNFPQPDFLNTGGRYDPASDTWTSTTLGVGVPGGRPLASSVWTGAEMIVWGGGSGGELQSGGLYDPATDSWRPTSTQGGVPSPRSHHTVVWTGADMIVWGGGQNAPPYKLDTGGRYDPLNDAWRPIAQAPLARNHHTAIWTGREMIVWGGETPNAYGDNTGDRYDPATDIWRPTSTGPGVPEGRVVHSAVWTGTEMIVWGGRGAGTWLQTGGRYDPASDTWRPTSTGANVPPGRWDHAAVWTGSRMIVWGGNQFHPFFKDGGLYDPVADSWQPMSTAGAPDLQYIVYDDTLTPAIWTGTEMIVWGDDGMGTAGGSRYDPASDSWSGASTFAQPCSRLYHNLVWTGSLMIVWGGDWTVLYSEIYLASGGLYDPAADAWGNPWQMTPMGDDILAGKAAGGTAAYPAALRGYNGEGKLTPTLIDAFPSYVGQGVNPAVGDIDAGGNAEVLAAPGPGPTFDALVAVFDRDGVSLPSCPFLAYGGGGFGCNVAAGAIDSLDETLTGPGPSPVYGPQVRAYRYRSGTPSAINKINFYAYGTLRFGVKVAASDLDGDAFDEILTGAGPGAPFGPHVRGFDYDDAAVNPIPGASFFAYGTPRFGVEVGAGNVDGQGSAEILTGPGPSPAFGPQLRGFRLTGGTITPVPGLNAFVFPGASYGINVASGDLDANGAGEIVCGAGPDPQYASRLRALRYAGSSLQGVPFLDMDAYGLSYGVRVAAGSIGY